MDPLRPFAHLIRSLWTSKRQAAGSAGAAAKGSDTQRPSVVVEPMPLANRLQTRLAALQQWNGGRARELFVEHILLMEFGEDLALDPAFAELVQRVSSHLGSEPAIGARLDALLQQLAAGQHVT
jgi:hypothetical protein